MVRHDNRADALLDALSGIFGGDDPLDDDRDLDRLAYFGHVIPVVPKPPVLNAVPVIRRKCDTARRACSRAAARRATPPGWRALFFGTRAAPTASPACTTCSLHDTTEIAVVKVALVDGRLL